MVAFALIRIPYALDKRRRVGIELPCFIYGFRLSRGSSAGPIRIGFPNGVIALRATFNKQPVFGHLSLLCGTERENQGFPCHF
jgi:hypothetical protein